MSTAIMNHAMNYEIKNEQMFFQLNKRTHYTKHFAVLIIIRHSAELCLDRFYDLPTPLDLHFHFFLTHHSSTTIYKQMQGHGTYQCAVYDGNE